MIGQIYRRNQSTIGISVPASDWLIGISVRVPPYKGAVPNKNKGVLFLDFFLKNKMFSYSVFRGGSFKVTFNQF